MYAISYPHLLAGVRAQGAGGLSVELGVVLDVVVRGVVGRRAADVDLVL